MAWYLFFIILSLPNIASTYHTIDSEIITNSTSQQSMSFATESDSQKPAAQFGISLDIKEPHLFLSTENYSISTESSNKHSFLITNRTHLSDNDTDRTSQQFSRNSNQKAILKLPFSSRTSISPTVAKSLNNPKIIFFKKIFINSSSLNITDDVEDRMKLTTFTLKEECNGTCNFILIPSNKLQTIDEVLTEIYESIKKENFRNSWKNETKCFNYNSSISNSSIFNSSLDDYLTNKFNCNIQNDIEKITCHNVSLYEISQYIPSETKEIDISESPRITLSKALFPHLKNLTYLKLHDNHHRYITRAFTGLHSLETLDLSKNDIQVLFRNIFTFTPNLKSLNLSMNSIIFLNSIAVALGNLKYFENLVLDYNHQIKQIFESELIPLRNTRLVELSLYSSTLHRVEKGSFRHLPFLKILDLSLNYLNEEALINVTSSVPKSLEYFGIVSLTRLSRFPVKPLTFLQNTSIYRIDLSNNVFSNLPKIPAMPSLKSLWISYCSMNKSESGAFDELPSLEELVLNNNELSKLAVSNASLNNLRILILKNQISRYNTKFRIPDFAFKNINRLEILDLSNIVISAKLSRFSLHGLKHLRLLDLSASKIQAIEDYAFETLSSLTLLVLNGNSLRYVNNFTFYGLQNLTRLYLSSNYLRFPQPIYPFQHSPYLNTLFLHNNRIVSLPEGIFSNIYNLEILTLSNNALSPWSSDIFGKKSYLKTLGLAENQISYVTPAMLSDFKQVTEFLDLSKNPFNCSACGMGDFQYFLKSSNLTFGLPLRGADLEASIVCAEPAVLRDQSFLDVEMTLMQCIEMQNEILNLFTLTLIVLAMLFVTLAVYLCYFFRWYIRYWFFHVQVKVKEAVLYDTKDRPSYVFDAFVSYNSHDNYWIAKHLIPSLEYKNPKYKLCVHERDFQIGRLITENILEAIEASRNVILILTEEFIKSEWCMFELHMAQHRLFDGTRDCLILVKLKDINKNIYTKNLMYLEKTRTCLKWTEDETDQKLFWERMRRCLGDPLRGSLSTEVCL